MFKLSNTPRHNGENRCNSISYSCRRFGLQGVKAFSFLCLVLISIVLTFNSAIAANVGDPSVVQGALDKINSNIHCEPYQNRLTASNGNQYCCGGEIFNVTSDGQCCAGEILKNGNVEICQNTCSIGSVICNKKTGECHSVT